MLTVNERVFFPTVEFTGLSPGVGDLKASVIVNSNQITATPDRRNSWVGGRWNKQSRRRLRRRDLAWDGFAKLWARVFLDPVDRTFHHRLRRFRNVAADLTASLRQSH